ncbi:MAG: hypothetical protein JSW00_00610 [Thermoplasmata archaeon]|nr:MAG: hypothetical protein JSW00_00610 [Thermoplasmata archaeon]
MLFILFTKPPSSTLYKAQTIEFHSPNAEYFQQRRKTVGRENMSKRKYKIRYTKKDDEWKKMCEDCDILSEFGDCAFGCELIIDSQKRKTKKSQR